MSGIQRTIRKSACFSCHGYCSDRAAGVFIQTKVLTHRQLLRDVSGVALERGHYLRVYMDRLR